MSTAVTNRFCRLLFLYGVDIKNALFFWNAASYITCVHDWLFFFQRSFQDAPQPSENSGNSGSKFFETSDKAFILKTIESEEVEMMHHLLPKYHQVFHLAHLRCLIRK